MAARLVLAVALLAASAAQGIPTAEAREWPLPTPFKASVAVVGPGGTQTTFAFGVAQNATSGYDEGVDVAAPPPPPGEPYVQAVLQIPEPRTYLTRLQTSLVGPTSEIVWEGRVSFGGGGDQIRFSWDSGAFATLDELLLVELEVGDAIVDMRTSSALAADVPAEAPWLDLRIMLHPPRGAPPGPPQNLQAEPTLRLGEILLRWEPPADDGGQPVQAYDVYRDGARIARVGPQAEFRDQPVPLGAVARYAVTATNVIGEGNASNEAIMIGTMPTSLTPAPSDDRERRLVLEIGLGGKSFRTPGAEQRLVRANGSEGRTDVWLSTPDGEKHLWTEWVQTPANVEHFHVGSQEGRVPRWAIAAEGWEDRDARHGISVTAQVEGQPALRQHVG